MSSQGETRFDTAALRGLAGEQAFARGEAYYRGKHVQILAIEPTRVLAQVAGSQDYRAELTGRGKQIGGECSCPAFRNWGFCKHMVAAALAANAGGDDARTSSIGVLPRIRGHLKTKSVDALVEIVLGLAEHDPALLRRLDLAAAVVQADDKTLEARLRRAIDSATRTEGYIDDGAVADWAKGVDAALDAIADLTTGKRARLAMKLADRVIERVERAAEAIDDSDGHCNALLDRARDVHLAAVCAVRPDPVRLARDLFAREMNDSCDVFRGAVSLYADPLGEEGLAEYRRLATEAWAKLPPLAASARDRPEGYFELKHILDFFAEREGDVAARIALRAGILASSWDYLQLAEFCLEQDRAEEALRWAEEGMWLFADERPDERLVLFAVDLLARADRLHDAEAHLWRAFERQPSLDLYARLRKLGGAPAGARAVEWLQSRFDNGTRTNWYNPADLLVSVLTHEEMYDAAWACVRRHAASVTVTQALARASEAAHPCEALAAYAGRVEQLAEAGGTSAYVEAATLIARMATLRTAAEQADYVTALKLRSGRRRNLMKLLE